MINNMDKEGLKELGIRVLEGMAVLGVVSTLILAGAADKLVPAINKMIADRKNIEQPKPTQAIHQEVTGYPSVEHVNYTYVTPTPVGYVKPFSELMNEIYGKKDFYTIQENDNLEKICKKHGLDKSFVEIIAKKNGIDNINFIRTGDILIIPSPGQMIAEQLKEGIVPKQRYVVVKPDEHIGNISVDNYGSDALAGSLAYLNKLNDPNILNEGIVIYIPNQESLILYEQENLDKISEYIDICNEQARSKLQM